MDHNQFLYGIHAVETLLNQDAKRILRICVLEDRHDKKIAAILQLAKNKQIAIEYVSRHELDQMTKEANHQGVVAFCAKSKGYSEADLPTLLNNISGPPFILILDSVQDPHNLGACFRSANAAGVNLIIAPKDKAVGITPVVSKVASGAAELVPFVQVTNLVRVIEILKEAGIWIYGAAGEATQNLFQADLKGAVAIVLGAEGEGLRRLTRDHCDVLLKIPMQGQVESLNVSVAAGIFLFEVVRQRIRSK